MECCLFPVEFADVRQVVGAGNASYQTSEIKKYFIFILSPHSVHDLPFQPDYSFVFRMYRLVASKMKYSARF